MSAKKYFIDNEKFMNLDIPEYIYILGFIWADGHISSKNNIELYTSSKDFINIKNILLKSGNWCIYKKDKFLKKTNKTYTSYTFRVCDKKLSRFLINLDFKEKSIKSPYKILNLIPNNLKHHFFRGYFDGDGSFSIYNNEKTCKFGLTSTLNQDWTFIDKLFSDININHYKIYKYKRIVGNSSYVSISNKSDIILIGEYVYKNSDGLRLERKFKTYNKIKNANIKKASPKWNKNDEDFLKNNYYKLGVNECAKILNRNIQSIYIKIHRLKNN